MGTPYLSEIKIMSFSFPPKGWALCNGQLLPINQNQGLFSLLGTTYGGDGRTTFALPNLQGRFQIHLGNGHTLGESAGELAHSLTLNELPLHTHALQGSSQPGNAVSPAGALLASPLNLTYRPSDNTAVLHPATVTNSGGGQPHLNQQPYLTLSFCIALQGIFPSQT